MSLTGQDKYRKGFEPLLEDVKFVPRDDLEALRAAVDDRTCAIVLEPIFGEGGIYECSTSFSSGVSRAGRPPSGRTDLRRDPMRTRPHRHHLCVPDIRGNAGYRRFRQTDCRGIAAGRISRPGGVCVRNLRGTARHNFWRRPSGLPRGPRIPGHHRRRKAAGKCFPGGRVPAANS